MNGATMMELSAPVRDAVPAHDGAVRTSPAWHALWTRSHCEQLVYDQLAAKGFDLFLPKIDQWSRRGGPRALLRLPTFPGHGLLPRAVDPARLVQVLKASGRVQG